MSSIISTSNGPVPYPDVTVLPPSENPGPGDVLLCYNLEQGDQCWETPEAGRWMVQLAWHLWPLFCICWPLLFVLPCFSSLFPDACRTKQQRPVYGPPPPSSNPSTSIQVGPPLQQQPMTATGYPVFKGPAGMDRMPQAYAIPKAGSTQLQQPPAAATRQASYVQTLQPQTLPGVVAAPGPAAGLSRSVPSPFGSRRQTGEAPTVVWT